MALAAVEESRAGETLNRSYVLEERVGGDRFREIYRARDLRAAKTVTVELLRPEFALAPQVAGRFITELQALLPLGHPNLVGVNAVDRDETGIPFAVRDHAEGQPLSLMLEQFPHGMPLGLAMTLLVPVCEALAAAHAHEISHGRVDAQHVLLVAHGGATVPMLLGLGSSVEPGSGAAPVRSPEQRRGHGAEPRSDVWALGRLLYQTLGGQPPPDDGRDAITSLEELAPHLPTKLVALIGRCLADNPLARPHTASHVARELSRLRGGQIAARNAAAAAAPERPRGRIGGRKTVMEPAHEPAAVAAEPARSAPEPSAPEIELGPVGDEALAFMSTVAAGASAPPSRAPQPAPPVLPALDDALPANDALAPTLADDEEPEIVLEAEPPQEAPTPPPVLSMRAVAAAFMPLEHDDELAPSTPEAAPAEPEPTPTARQTPTSKERPSRRKSAAELGPKALRERVDKSQGERKPVPLVVPAERKRNRRALGFLWFLLFCIALVPALPLLLDGSRAQAQTLFGERMTLAGAGLSILAVVSLIRSWAIQIQSKPMLIAPVTWSLKVVTFCICALVAGWFLPAGALGPIEGLARSVLPWGAGGFFLFLGAYALLKGIRELPHQTFVALIALLCGMGSLFGSYRATMLGVQAHAAGGRTVLRAHRDDGETDAEAAPDGGTSEDESIGFEPGRIQDMMHGELGDAEQGEAPGERHEVGGGENSDLEGVEELRRSRHKRGDSYDRLREKIPGMLR